METEVEKAIEYISYLFGVRMDIYDIIDEVETTHPKLSKIDLDMFVLEIVRLFEGDFNSIQELVDDRRVGKGVQKWLYKKVNS